MWYKDVDTAVNHLVWGAVDDGFGRPASPGPSPSGGGLGTGSRFLNRSGPDSAAVLRTWHAAKGHCWALPSTRTRMMLNVMVRQPPAWGHGIRGKGDLLVGHSAWV